MIAPVVLQDHDGMMVARDDLTGGGTKTRYMVQMFEGVDELVYATPAEGGAQSALAWAARETGKRATIFVAKRAKPHPRSLLAKKYGATVYQVPHGYLNVVQKRAADYCAATGANLIPFGMDTPEAIACIADAARATGYQPDEVWCASGSGVLARALGQAFPDADRYCVQIGRDLKPADTAGATVIKHPLKFGQACKIKTPFPSDPHYDAKAWEIALERRGSGKVLFWNVTGPA
jgi:hypothetical protein